jgi:hypothetical protein
MSSSSDILFDAKYNQEYNDVYNKIFNGVTSFQELKDGGNTKMPIKDDFTEKDKVQINMDFWKFKEQKEIIGFFSRWENDNYGEHAVVSVDDKELHLPNLMALNGKLKTGKAVPNSKVKIVYSGQTKAKSGRLYEDFVVSVKK